MSTQTAQSDAGLADGYLFQIGTSASFAVIGMNSPLPFVPLVPRLRAWLAVTQPKPEEAPRH